jgi:CRP/FNR family cyclic AMP-dependent transcriptional regulator
LVLEDSLAVRVQKQAALKLMTADVCFDEFLIRHLIKSGIRTQEQLLDHMFNSSEKRLARTLVMLANDATGRAQDIAIPKISQKMLAEMVGATRRRINQFMNKFRKLGYIDYDGMAITVRHSLLTVLLYESSRDTDSTPARFRSMRFVSLIPTTRPRRIPSLRLAGTCF